MSERFYDKPTGQGDFVVGDTCGISEDADMSNPMNGLMRPVYFEDQGHARTHRIFLNHRIEEHDVIREERDLYRKAYENVEKWRKAIEVENDALKKALREWVEARRRVILIAEIPDWRREKIEYEEAKQSERASFAAAEAVLEKDDATDEANAGSATS